MTAAATSSSGRKPKRGSEFMCHVKFKNSLPDPPVDYKMIAFAPDLSASIPYIPTSLEHKYKYKVPADILHTKLVDFVDLDAFKPDMNELLPVEDEPLLIPFDQLERKRKAAAEKRVAAGAKTATRKGTIKDANSRRPDVTWLRRTEYISSEFGKTGTRPNTGGSQTALASAANQNQKDAGKLEKLCTKEDLLEIVEDSFQETSLEHLVHPVNPSVRAVKSFPILLSPSSELGASFTQCLFDHDPKSATGLGEVPTAPDADSGALLRAMSNPNNPSDSFVWYYLAEVDNHDSFVYVRDYDIQRNERFAGSLHTLLVDESGQKPARLIPITTQFQLKKRRMKANDLARQPHILEITRRLA